MTTPATLPRSVRLKEWMDEHPITYRATGEQLGITEQAARKFLLRECCIKNVIMAYSS